MKLFNLHTHHFSNDASILELVNQYPWEFKESIPYYSVGIHPWFIDENRLEADLRLMEEKLPLESCLAVGECGLDKRIEIPMNVQIEVFEKQIILAEHYQKPLILHVVAAFDELIAIKNKLNIGVPIIIHGFSKNAQVAKQLVDNGFYVSFGKYLLRNPEMETVFQSIPNDRFFLETDTIEEALGAVYELAAKYKDITTEKLIKIINTNYNTVFKSNI